MKIRPLKAEDFNSIVDMLIRHNIEPPAEISDLGGLCMVAERDGEIVGCIHALIGNCTKAYLDYYVFEDKMTGFKLLQHMEVALRFAGIKRFDFHVEKYNTAFERLAEKYGCARLRDLTWFRKEVG